MLAHLSWAGCVVFPGREGEQAGFCQVAQMFRDNPQGLSRWMGTVSSSEQGSLKVFPAAIIHLGALSAR